MYSCNFCTFETPFLNKHLEHHTYHRNVNRHNYYCGYNKCKKYFSDLAYLNTHLHRMHGVETMKEKVSYTGFPADDRAKFVCTINTCRKEVDSFNLLVKHFKTHIKNGQEVICPYRECNRTYSVVSSFTSHLSKYHVRNSSIHDLDYNAIQVNFEIEECVDDSSTGPEIDLQESLNIQDETDSEANLFIRNIVQFYLKLESELLIPASTIQYIVEEINTIHHQGQDKIKENLKARLLKENFDSNKTEDIIKAIFSTDPWIASHDIIRTNYKRKQFYKKQFDYVQPIFVDINKEKKTSFAYVPILDTLKSVFKDKSLENVFNLRAAEPNEDYFKDFTDGEVFKNNNFFKNNVEALQIIIYQDSFEVVNPIGAAKKKHKILAIYMNIGNIPDVFRSHVNTIKLVALVREKDFEHNVVYGKLVEDLKILESEGINVNGKSIKGSLVFITGDNLGSHGLGGFNENFSKSKYFCRFCKVTRDEFHSDEGECQFYELRTITSYTEALNRTGNKNEREGIKFDSVFNKLSHYHVCMPGLPPCLGHDLFEGIVAYDLLLYIEYFIQNNWFTLDNLNKKITNFQYSIDDNQSKPCIISSNNTKIPGGACQIWNFLRLFPILINDKIVDMHDEVWMCVLLLSEIVEIVCAPMIHKSYLGYLQNQIFQYLSMRKMLFPGVNLRPKHHFLTHYCYLITQFGPLMKVWTLRYESKHRYFKRVVRHILNFINLLKSLSEKHELFQCLIRLGSDIRIETAVYEVSDFQVQLYNAEIQECIKNSELPTRYSKQCNKVIIKGTTYKQGDILAFNQKVYRHQIIFGKICLFLFFNEEKIYILYEILENEYIPYLNAYQVGKTTSYACGHLEEALDYKPMHVYTTNNKLYIKPSHAFVSRQI